ncbi:MAG: hypothetical protein AAGF90_15370 [Pseudomonadota bacterium]
MLREFLAYLGLGSAVTEETENISLLRQFFMKLNATYLRLTRDLPPERLDKPDLTRVREILSKDTGQNPPVVFWRDAYEAEQLMVSIMPAAEARADLIKFMDDAKRLEISSYDAYREEFADLAKNPQTGVDGSAEAGQARALLLRVLDDLQWRYSQRYHLRRICQLYMLRMFFVFSVIAICFAAALFTYRYLAAEGLTGGFTAYPLALSAGLLGAAFSMLTGRQEVLAIGSIEAMRSATHLSMVLLRLGVGGGAAAIFYFLFDSGFFDTQLFPDTKGMGFEPIGEASAEAPMVPNAELRLRIVWSFLAGFSEKLVPAILASKQEAPA